MQDIIRQLDEQRAAAAWAEAAPDRSAHAKGKLTARERLDCCSMRSFEEWTCRRAPLSRLGMSEARVPGDGWSPATARQRTARVRVQPGLPVSAVRCRKRTPEDLQSMDTHQGRCAVIGLNDSGGQDPGRRGLLGGYADVFQRTCWPRRRAASVADHGAVRGRPSIRGHDRFI